MQKKQFKPGNSTVLLKKNKTATLAEIAKLLQQAIALHQNGQLAEAVQLYQQILTLDTQHFDALHLFGIALNKMGDSLKALELIERAVKLNPANASVHAVHGNILLELMRHEEALVCYEQFLLLMPDFPEVLNNRGNALAVLGRHQDALLSYEKALALQADYIDAHFNRGNLYMTMRHYADALRDYDKVLSINGRHLQALNNRGNVLQKLERIEDAAQSYLTGLAIAPDNADLHASIASVYKKQVRLSEAIAHYSKSLELNQQGFTAQNAALQMAILHFLYGNESNIDPLLNIARGMLGAALLTDVGSQIYCVFVSKIHYWWSQQLAANRSASALENLYVIGESHSFSAHKMRLEYQGRPYQGKSLWIEGCKQWHIGNTQQNHYKQLLSTFINAIPAGSKVMLTIGEIDCRIDGGVMKAWKKSPTTDMQAVINSTIDSYLNALVNLTQQKACKLIISGVPAHNLAEEAAKSEDMPVFTKVLRMFNEYLKQAALQRGMDFLDVFAMTDSGNSKSNQQWHIDEHHLRPDGVARAFSHHLISAT
ncbi:tetratricopeptide repeat protein [Undibacterium sp. TJN19]|uniref:tetratricopeptide repeat protein n=1 Tax=Undibacterium sp. TJN19 TaxID=3413055 RepID=UPI003BF32B1A